MNNGNQTHAMDLTGMLPEDLKQEHGYGDPEETARALVAEFGTPFATCYGAPTFDPFKTGWENVDERIDRELAAKKGGQRTDSVLGIAPQPAVFGRQTTDEGRLNAARRRNGYTGKKTKFRYDGRRPVAVGR